MIARLLYSITRKKPCRLIYLDGEKPYLERYFLGQMFGLTFYLHRFVSGDSDRHVHDHPWTIARAWILCGGYTERRLVAMCPKRGMITEDKKLRIGNLNTIKGNDFHQVMEPRPGTWTLFWHTPRVKHWGFMEELGTHSIIYHQPLGIYDSGDWWNDCPNGDDAGREPLELTEIHVPKASRTVLKNWCSLYDVSPKWYWTKNRIRRELVDRWKLRCPSESR